MSCPICSLPGGPKRPASSPLCDLLPVSATSLGKQKPATGTEASLPPLPPRPLAFRAGWSPFSPSTASSSPFASPLLVATLLQGAVGTVPDSSPPAFLSYLLRPAFALAAPLELPSEGSPVASMSQAQYYSTTGSHPTRFIVHLPAPITFLGRLPGPTPGLRTCVWTAPLTLPCCSSPST